MTSTHSAPPTFGRLAASAPSLTVMLAQGVVTVPHTDIPVTHADALSRTDREVVVHERSSLCRAQSERQAVTVAKESLNSSLPVLTITRANIVRINSKEDSEEMANLRHPVDIGLEDLAFLRRDIEQDFLEDDGVVCESELGVLTQFDQAVSLMRRAREREKAFQLAVKQDFKITRYTRQQFAEAGLSIGPIEPDAA